GRNKESTMTTSITVNGKEPGSAPAAEPLLPSQVDRRAFLMRSGVIGAAAVMTGATWTPEARAAQAAKEAAEFTAKPQPGLGAAPVDPKLDVSQKSKGPVMTVAD